MCSCDSGTPCAAHRGTRHTDDYHDPLNEVSRPEEAVDESLARVMFVCNPDESAGLADL